MPRQITLNKILQREIIEALRSAKSQLDHIAKQPPGLTRQVTAKEFDWQRERIGTILEHLTQAEQGGPQPTKTTFKACNSCGLLCHVDLLDSKGLCVDCGDRDDPDEYDPDEYDEEGEYPCAGDCGEPVGYPGQYCAGCRMEGLGD